MYSFVTCTHPKVCAPAALKACHLSQLYTRHFDKSFILLKLHTTSNFSSRSKFLELERLGGSFPVEIQDPNTRIAHGTDTNVGSLISGVDSPTKTLRRRFGGSVCEPGRGQSYNLRTT